MARPFFSIIIVSLNAEDLIAETVESVLNQSYDNYEIIVKDGKSNDDTLKKIPTDQKISVYCKLDKSIYDAMNQATENAKGDYIIYLNCGDKLNDKDVLKDAHTYLTKNEKIDVLYGDYNRLNLGIVRQPSKESTFQLIRKPLCHQSMFFKRKAILKFGLYNDSYIISADYDLTIRLYNKMCRFQYFPRVICIYQGGGLSERNITKLKQEVKEIRKFHFSPWVRCVHGIYSILTLSGIRFWLASDNSPKILRVFFAKARNYIGRLEGK